MSGSLKYSREGRPKPKDDWRTPPELYAALDRQFHFAVDVACEAHNQLAPAGIRADEGGDALLLPWSTYGGAVWCNPPYSKLRPWIEQGLRAASLVPVVFLIPADPSTRWWIECVAYDAHEVRFLVGRVRFLKPDGTVHATSTHNSGGMNTPSAIVVFRPAGGPPRYSYMSGRPPYGGRRLSTGDPRYVMPCSGCGTKWYTTAPERHENATCRGVEPGTGKRIGCGRKLPAPVLERREE